MNQRTNTIILYLRIDVQTNSMNVKGFHNIIFCHCYSQNTADVKFFTFYVILKKYMKSFKYNGIFFLSLKGQYGSVMNKTNNKDLHYSMPKLYFEKFSDLPNRDT